MATSEDSAAKKSKTARAARSGNPAKAAAAQEESRAAANRVSRSPQKVKDAASPAWYAPTLVTLMVVGLLWVVVTYLFKGEYPIPWFVQAHSTDWLINGNLYIGFVLMIVGFLGLMRWR